MSTRLRIEDAILDNIAGGAVIENTFEGSGGGKYYRLRRDDGDWEFYFRATDYDTVVAAMKAHKDPNKTQAQNDQELIDEISSLLIPV